MKEIASKELMRGVSIPKSEELSFCESCIEGKMQRKPFEPLKEVCSTRNYNVSTVTFVVQCLLSH